MPTTHEKVRARFEHPVRVYYEDTDAAGIVYYANYLKFLERARTEWLRTLGVSQEQLAREQGIAFAVRSLAAEYHKPARLDDLLRVVAEIESLGRAQLVFKQRVERADELLVEGRVRIACIDIHRMKPVAIPHAIRHTLETLL